MLVIAKPEDKPRPTTTLNSTWLSHRVASRGESVKMAVYFKIIVFVQAMLQIANATEDINLTVNPTQFFKSINQDASLVTWAHAVNSAEELTAALNNSVMMLEADISSGHVVGETTGTPIPIMAHPPSTTSNISFQKWLETVIEANKTKGIKLDFKNISVVEESLTLLNSHQPQISFPVFINADILPGPSNSPATPVDADQFLTLVQKWYPQCILSVGWTTRYNASTEAWYTWQHVTQMFKILQKHAITQELSFPIRAIFLDRSYQQLRWLTEFLPKSGMTVWSAQDDPVDVSGFTATLVNYNKDSVYFDLPRPLHSGFIDLKNEVLGRGNTRTMPASSWLVEDEGCAFPTSEAVVLDGTCSVLNTKQFVASTGHPIVHSGVVEFLDRNLVWESVAIGLRTHPWLWVRIYANGKVVEPNSSVISDLESDDLSVQCFRFQIEDEGGSNPIKVKIMVVEPPMYSGLGEGVSFQVDVPDGVGAVVGGLAFNATGVGVKVIHSFVFDNNVNK